MSLSDLFFELSNETRIIILNQLDAEPMRLTEISKNLDLPAQEISRQLSRLDKMSLVRRDPEGLYHVTPYARQILELLQGYEFYFMHHEYFTEHTLEELPPRFSNRIGELQKLSYEHDLMTTLHRLDGALQRAEIYIHIMLNQIVSHTMPTLQEKVKAGVEFFFLTTKDINPPPGVWKSFQVQPKDLKNPQKLDTRFLGTIPLGLVITEKEVGLITFKTTEYEFDYIGFYGDNALAHEWASDVFNYYWEKSSDKWPDRLLDRVLKESG